MRERKSTTTTNKFCSMSKSNSNDGLRNRKQSGDCDHRVDYVSAYKKIVEPPPPHVHTIDCIWKASNYTFGAIFMMVILLVLVLTQNFYIGKFVLHNQSKMYEILDMLNNNNNKTG